MRCSSGVALVFGREKVMYTRFWMCTTSSLSQELDQHLGIQTFFDYGITSAGWRLRGDVDADDDTRRYSALQYGDPPVQQAAVFEVVIQHFLYS